MAPDEPKTRDTVPTAPDIDGDGIDRAQIRAMLALTPGERLLRAQAFLDAALEIRALNGKPTLR